ncbi:remodeling and spacing factor 1-like isoform X2 [Rhizophagus irregularis DAOM 181602=DAOM 197198]|nr:remodeling and spacing factor 1-like isoform X2 [Rhizophagus irregularis DAOM 181602=DAOM 197198]
MSFSEMSFSDFSSRLETVIVLSEEIVKSCQSAKNHKILERFGNKVSEALKVLTNLKNSKDHFFNKENATLLERLINDIENIKNFVDYHISSSEEISKSKILIILKIKKLFEARKFEKSFDNNLVNIQRSIEGSKERDNNNETRDVEVPTDDDEIKVPTDVDEIKVPTDVDEIKVPTDDDEIKVPTDDDEIKVPTDVDEIKVPADDDEIKVPTDVDEIKVPTDVDEIKVPTDDDEIKVPTDDDEIKVPTDDDEIKVPTDDDEIKVPTDDDEIKVPTDVDEIKVPTDVDEIKVPTDDDENTDDVSIVYTKDANENKTNNNIIRVPTDDANDNSSKIQTKIIIDTNVPKDNDSVELVLSPTDISIPTGKSTIFSSSEIDENGNETTIKTEIKPGKNGKPATTVRKNTIDSKGTTIFELTTLFFEPEENSSEGKVITESDKSMTILQGDQLTKTGDSRKMKKKTKTYSKNETNDFGIVTSTTTEIKTDEDGKPTVTVTTEKFIGNKDEKIPETKFSSSEIDENGNVTTTTTETTTREDGKTEARVRIETKDLNDKTIHNESFVSRPDDVNKEETTLEMVKTDSFGVPMKNQTNTLFSETDEHGIKTIITTIIKTRAKETKVPEVIIKKVKINDNKLLKS